MKLEKKHFAAYLPYGLKCEVINWSEKNGRYETYHATMDSVYADGTCTFHELVEAEQGVESIKPILRPLSDLVKKIEFEGKKVFPSEVILERTGYDILTNKEQLIEPIKRLPYVVVCLLIEMHFDVFGLINDGRAIDVNTLK